MNKNVTLTYIRSIFIGCAIFMIIAALLQTAWAQDTIAQHIDPKVVSELYLSS